METLRLLLVWYLGLLTRSESMVQSRLARHFRVSTLLFLQSILVDASYIKVAVRTCTFLQVYVWGNSLLSISAIANS
jgi:hypothetical protein